MSNVFHEHTFAKNGNEYIRVEFDPTEYLSILRVDKVRLFDGVWSDGEINNKRFIVKIPEGNDPLDVNHC